MRKIWKLLLPASNESEADCLVLQDDADGSTGGAFIYYLNSAHPGECFGDEWYESADIAQYIIATEYGMSITNWQVIKPEDITGFLADLLS